MSDKTKPRKKIITSKLFTFKLYPIQFYIYFIVTSLLQLVFIITEESNKQMQTPLPIPS